MQHLRSLGAFLILSQLAHTAYLRHDVGEIHLSRSHISQVVRANTSAIQSSQCALAANTSAHRVAKQTAYQLDSTKEPPRVTTLRVCNALTTRREAVINMFFNGEQLNSKPIKGRNCEEYSIQYASSNKFEVKLTGRVVSEWSEEKSASEMADIPILFLVAYAFGNGDETTFSVNEFHGESNGLESVQVAYMDIYRGAPPAKVQLLSSGGDFELAGGSYVTICSGHYSVQFLHDGSSTPVESHTKLHTKPGEQYVLLRLAPEGTNGYTEGDKEEVIVFPDSSVAVSGKTLGLGVSALLFWIQAAMMAIS